MTKIEDIRKKAQYALEIPAAQNNFLTKRLNIWTQQASRWLSLELWDANNTGTVDEDDFTGRECVGGLDLAVVSDLLCWVMAFPDINDPERLDILMRCWCPEARLHDTRNKYRDIYQAWERQGLLKTSEGDAVDYEFVRDQIKQDARKFKITAISVDRLFQGYEFSQKLDTDLGGTEKKPKVIACGMGYLSMAAPCNELERLLLIKKLNHGGNPILRFMADSVAVSMDPAGNKKPNKDKSQGKIDGIIGILLCLDRLLRAPVKKSVYEERGIITL
jgi:phage terminase large subunit-like protein